MERLRGEECPAGGIEIIPNQFHRLLQEVTARPAACTKPGSGANQENLVSRQVSGQWATRPVDILICVGLSFSVVVYFIVDRRPLLVDSLLLLASSRLSH